MSCWVAQSHPEPSTNLFQYVDLLMQYCVDVQQCFHMEIMIWAWNHTHILNRSYILILCHLGEEDNNILELFFLSIEEELHPFQSVRRMETALLEC